MEVGECAGIADSNVSGKDLDQVTKLLGYLRRGVHGLRNLEANGIGELFTETVDRDFHCADSEKTLRPILKERGAQGTDGTAASRCLSRFSFFFRAAIRLVFPACFALRRARSVPRILDLRERTKGP